MIERCGGECVRPVGHEGACRPTWHAYPRCGAFMRWAKEPCARRRGHGGLAGGHRTADALANRRASDLASRARAWDNDADEYSVPIAHNAQRPSARLYSGSEGVDIPEYRRND